MAKHHTFSYYPFPPTGTTPPHIRAIIRSYDNLFTHWLDAPSGSQYLFRWMRPGWIRGQYTLKMTAGHRIAMQRSSAVMNGNDICLIFIYYSIDNSVITLNQFPDTIMLNFRHYSATSDLPGDDLHNFKKRFTWIFAYLTESLAMNSAILSTSASACCVHLISAIC